MKQKVTEVTAATIIIGNEILSGQTQDINIQYIAQALQKRAIMLHEVRIVKDTIDGIAEHVNLLRKTYDYVFTTGGIGPTHDDVTAEAIAHAFSVPLIQNQDAVRRLQDYYRDEISESRLLMARMPDGAKLIDNPISAAPGFNMENVYVLPGVPRIMQAMLDNLSQQLLGGDQIFDHTIRAFVAESVIASGLGKIQQAHAGIEIGSYPYSHQNKSCCAFVIRGFVPKHVDAVAKKITDLIGTLGAKTIDG